MMNTTQEIPTKDELRQSILSAASHSNDTGWMIYRFLKGNLDSLSSEEARKLMASYMDLQLPMPSVLHSCMLTVALKMTEKFSDFRLTAFLKMWGYPQNLREDDKRKQTGKDGKTYLSLHERLERCLQSYLLHHAEEQTNENTDAIQTMMAVKVFTTEKNGRKLNSVKLVGTDGQELIAERHQFPCKPWEIVGRMFDVLTRVSKNDIVRVQELVVSQKRVGEVFSLETGYVERIDAQHNHYHVYDNKSRHFVAENPKAKPQAGDFVEFAPIIPAQDKFKSAVITRVLSQEAGMEQFGLYDATVTYINTEKGYFYYKITSEIRPTTEGEITQEGSAQLSLFANAAEVKVGMPIHILMFLTRGKDGKKRNHVARIIQ